MSKDKKELEMNKKMSRRGFMKVGGLAVGTVAAGLVTGCGGDVEVNASRDNSTNTPPASNIPSSWDDTADIVVIGFGGAGAMAAIHATNEDAAAKVLILEAQATGGGSTAICGGGTHLGGGTSLQVEYGFTETKDELYAHALATAGEGKNPEMLRVYADNSKDTYDSLVSIGFHYEGYDPGYWGSAPDGKSLVYDNERRPEYLAESGLTAGVPHLHFGIAAEGSSRSATFWKALQEKTESISNVSISYETEVKELIVDNDGRVVGVAAEKGGTTYYFKASKAVLVASGGFIKNDEMVEQFIPHAMNCFRGGNPMDTGTGIKMAQVIGADVKMMNAAEDWCPTYRSDTALVKAIAVTPNGDRFAPEDFGGPEMGKWIARVYPLSYIVFDQSIMDEIPEAARPSLGAVSANTIEELADLIDVPAEYLATTVSRYNTFAANGYDSQCQKDPNVLQPIVTAPFYAQTRKRSDVFTLSCGGLRINTKAQVLRTDGSVIPGLYAAGATTAHINAQFYLSGGGTAGAFVFGRIAGLEMLNEEDWDA
jgi:succinate dehydrogenase/fumarate reductase flavoprotein subunit